jgi:hypothetical protein
MTSIAPETQVVASSYDALNRICTYTYQHTDGSRYTVTIPLDEMTKIGSTAATRDQRQRLLATKIMNHIQTNRPDEQQ